MAAIIGSYMGQNDLTDEQFVNRLLSEALENQLGEPTAPPALFKKRHGTERIVKGVRRRNGCEA